MWVIPIHKCIFYHHMIPCPYMLTLFPLSLTCVIFVHLSLKIPKSLFCCDHCSRIQPLLTILYFPWSLMPSINLYGINHWSFSSSISHFSLKVVKEQNHLWSLISWILPVISLKICNRLLKLRLLWFRRLILLIWKSFTPKNMKK